MKPTLAIVCGVFASAGVFAHHTNAMAQEGASIEDAIAACSTIKNRSSRLECFDSLSNAVDEVSPEEPGAPETASRAIDGAAVRIAPVAPPASEPPVEPPTAPVAVAPAPAPQEPVDSVEAAESDQRFLIIPREDPRAQAVRPPEWSAEIVKVTLRNDRIMVRLDNGETWKQTSRNRPRTPKVGMVAHFSKGLAGGWFVKFGERNGKYSVSLVQ